MTENLPIDLSRSIEPQSMTVTVNENSISRFGLEPSICDRQRTIGKPGALTEGMHRVWWTLPI